MKFDQSAEINDAEAQGIIRDIVANGFLIISNHAKKRMVERGYTTHDVEYILLHGSISGKEFNPKLNNWVYTVNGHDLDGDMGGVVTAIVERMTSLVITVLS